jgi:hypothetical protein
MWRLQDEHADPPKHAAVADICCALATSLIVGSRASFSALKVDKNELLYAYANISETLAICHFLLKRPPIPAKLTQLCFFFNLKI